MTNQEIKTVGQTIAQETQIGGNTAARVGGVVEGIGVALDNKDAANGYYQATISGGTITVNAPNYLLGTGGNLRIKMPSVGTTASTLTIGNANAVQLWYNGAAVSAQNTWDANEIISVFYDGTRFMASNSQGGGGKAEKIKYDNSQSGLAAGNVQEALDALSEDVDEAASIKQNSSAADLDVADPNGYILLRLENGHVKTKRFDSSKLAQIGIADADTEFNIADEQGYVILRVDGGNIFVKNFTNAPLRGKKVAFMGDSITTYEGYPGSYVNYYKASNMNITGMTSVDKTWWKALCDKQGATVNRIYAYGGGDVATNICLHYNELYSNGTTGTPPDFIFILAGINDYGHNIALGTINDAEAANSSFYAGYKYLLGHLKTEYPNAIIIGLTMLNSMYLGTTVPYINNNGDSIIDFCDAIKKCCDFYSIPYIDLNKLVNINGGNYTTYLADYTHPNSVGASLVTNAIKNNIINLTNE